MTYVYSGISLSKHTYLHDIVYVHISSPQPVMKVLSESQLPSDILSIAVQLAASLILVSPNVPECRAHLAQLVKGVAKCDGGRSQNKEDVGIILEFFKELADKYDGFEYVRSIHMHIAL